jgi:hypothetical protein
MKSDSWDTFATQYWNWVTKCKDFKNYWRWWDIYGPQHQFSKWQSERLKVIIFRSFSKYKAKRQLHLDSYDLKQRRLS